MGLFINTLPMRIPVGGQGVEASVRQTHALLADLLRHEHASLSLAQRCSAVPPPAPLFSSLFNYRHSAGAKLAGSEEEKDVWKGIHRLRGEERTNYPITLSVDDLGESFALTAQTPPSIRPMRLCEFMQTALESLVDALQASPARAVRTLEVLPESERHQLLYGWNNTQTEYRDQCIHELFEAQVAQTPQTTAVVCGEERLSYAALNTQANQLAHHLVELGVKPDDRVALCLERGITMIVAVLAVLKAGGAYVPLDPAYPVERLRFMLEDSQPVALLTQSHLQDLFTTSDGTPTVLLLEDAGLWSNQSTSNIASASIGLGSRHLAYLIYTSGSTGQPKGVMVEHRGLCNLVIAQIRGFEVSAASHVLQFASFSFDACISEVMMALCRGASLHLVSRRQVVACDTLADAIRNGGITHATLPPAVLAGFSEPGALDSIRVLITAGDVLSDSLARQWKQGRKLINAYGPSESTVCATIYDCDAFQSGNPPIGHPIANTQIYILDEHRQPAPIGVTGELYIGGVQVARGYLNRAALTAEKFLTDPFASEPEARMYRTGDLGRWLPDGNIEFLGRNDFQVKLRGFRIELGEIEARLAEYPGLREAVVIAREDTPGDKRLVAYYIAHPMVRNAGAFDSAPYALNAEQLRSHLSAHLPEYMVPAAYVPLEAFPLTANGKLDRHALPAPEQDAYPSQAYEAPQGDTEIRLAQIWADLLKLDRVGRHDNFFALGGHSLLAVRVVTRIRQSLNIDISLTDLFDHPVLASLADYAVTLQLCQYNPNDLLKVLQQMQRV
jgi:amino acid adenylation domain-containing protein